MAEGAEERLAHMLSRADRHPFVCILEVCTVCTLAVKTMDTPEELNVFSFILIDY